MPPQADRLSSMATSADGNASMMNESVAVSYMGAVSLSEPVVPVDFTPSLAPTVDPEMLVDASGRKKRLWLLTVTPGTSTAELEGAKLRKSKCTVSSGTQFRATTRVKKDYIALVMNCALESVAVRTRVAGSVSLSRQIDVPGMRFDPTEQKVFALTEDARQRYVPFGSMEPVAHSRLPVDEASSPAKKRKKKKSKR
ncbi:hypothetical protein BIW11_06705 [Tropilaelaps mercedesae]|uniref:Uncharacterized protein n=1 Tax=Tropilaelaps mercedesae TaxID=418985 RepID=A0A1V9XWZ3_9ACAR|nr:hypothetical protein BIW11_06705 [Tropilaelaps mercedesae]